MRIHVSSGHTYPGWRNGVSVHVVHDYLVQGLAELGHDVRYQLNGWGGARPPEGVRPVADVAGDEDILHINHLPLWESPATALPWVRSVHYDLLYHRRDGRAFDHAESWERGVHTDGPSQGLPPSSVTPNCIFVSQTLAGLYGSDRYVHNGIDPANFIYSEAKEDYFLFAVAGDVWKARNKGLDIALRVAKLSGTELRVAGGINDPAEMAKLARYCRDNGAVSLGRVHGRRKAEVFAGARALLFPTQMNEAFGLTVAEALMSGTPVIASDKGAMAELLNPSVGFVCAEESSYLDAVAGLSGIAPGDCRRLAMERFHYLEMARSYVREYQREIARTSHGRG